MLCGDEIGAIVIDIGASTCKFGFAGQDTPKIVFQSTVGYYEDVQRFVVGDVNLRIVRENMKMIDPFGDFSTNAINWDAFESIISYGFQEIGANPQESPVLCCIGHFSTEALQIKLVDLFFDRFNVPAIFLASNASLSAFTCTVPTALVLDFGYYCLSITAVIDGYSLKRNQKFIDFGGKHLNSIKMSSEDDTIDESHLPEGYNIEKLAQYVMSSISNLDVDVRREVANNIVLAGGGSLPKGLPQYLSYAIAAMVPSNFKTRIIPVLPIEQQFAAWIGGSILASCGTFHQMWLSKEEYVESGPIIISLRFQY